ncbi:MAG: family N-acetyltransferase [Candidatus Solibacter sp.]|nr:family N-acetyltransferase [Candidatus Solibacter sp.]
MTVEDIDVGLRLCRASGWNQLDADWRCFLRANPAGCRVALVDEEVAGTVTTLRHEDHFSWISMLLVAPERRRQGIGTALLMEALRVLEDVRCVRLDASPAGKAVYEQHGFRDEYPLVRMRAESVAVGPAEGVRPMQECDVEAVEKLDREIFGARRRIVFNHLRSSAPEYAFVAETAGDLAGYAMGRRGFLSPQIGPVVARDARIAASLVSACCPQSCVLDIPQYDAEWLRWLESAGFRRERPFMRMFRGEAPACGRPELQFAIAGPEFG